MSNSELQTRISMYKCPYCNSIFYSLSDLRSHFFKQHKSENMKCPFCNFESKTYDEFALHLLMTKEKSHDDLLKLLFNQIKELTENGNVFEIIREVTNIENQTLENENVENDISQIQIEDNQVQETNSQKTKIRKSKSKTRLKCPYCDYVTTWRKNLYHHINICHIKDNQKVESQIENKDNEVNNSKSEIIDFDKCPYCGQEFIRISELRFHIKSVHLSNNYSCPFCKIEFEVPLLLLAHLWNSDDKKHRYLHNLITRD